MGQNQSENREELRKKYEYHQEIKTQFYQGKILRIKDNDNEDFLFCREIFFQSQKTFEIMKEAIKGRENLKQSPDIVQLIENHESRLNNLCSHSDTFCLIFEYFPHTLSSEIKLRMSNDKYFTIDQLKGFIINAVNGLASMQLNKIAHENICSETLSLKQINNNSFKLLVQDTKMYTEFKNTIYSQLTQDHSNKKGFYLSPMLTQVFINLKYMRQEVHKHNLSVTHEVYKSDVFSLGLTLLEAALLRRVDSLYNYDQGVIIEKQLKYLLQELQKRYADSSNQSVQFVVNAFTVMLEIEENKRPDFIKLKELFGNQDDNTKKQVKILVNQLIFQSDHALFINQQNKSFVNVTIYNYILENITFSKIGGKNKIYIRKKFKLVRKYARKKQFILTYFKNIIIKVISFAQIFINLKFKSTQSRYDFTNEIQNYSVGYSPIARKSGINQKQLNFIDIIIETYNDGTRYEGQKLMNMKNGLGILFYSDGGRYEGFWKNDQAHGKGTLFYSNGRPAYEGDWEFGLIQGSGVLYNQYPKILPNYFDGFNFDMASESWTKYEGDFVKDCREGNGILYFIGGSKFVGQFIADKIHGIGYFYDELGKLIIMGTWAENQFIHY